MGNCENIDIFCARNLNLVRLLSGKACSVGMDTVRGIGLGAASSTYLVRLY